VVPTVSSTGKAPYLFGKEALHVCMRHPVCVCPSETQIDFTLCQRKLLDPEVLETCVWSQEAAEVEFESGVYFPL
jgi:hypothetical protein